MSTKFDYRFYLFPFYYFYFYVICNHHSTWKEFIFVFIYFVQWLSLVYLFNNKLVSMLFAELFTIIVVIFNIYYLIGENELKERTSGILTKLSIFLGYVCYMLTFLFMIIDVFMSYSVFSNSELNVNHSALFISVVVMIVLSCYSFFSGTRMYEILPKGELLIASKYINNNTIHLYFLIGIMMLVNTAGSHLNQFLAVINGMFF